MNKIKIVSMIISLMMLVLVARVIYMLHTTHHGYQEIQVHETFNDWNESLGFVVDRERVAIYTDFIGYQSAKYQIEINCGERFSGSSWDYNRKIVYKDTLLNVEVEFCNPSKEIYRAVRLFVPDDDVSMHVVER